MRAPPSLVHAVVRAYVVGIVLAALAIVVAGGISAALVVLHRDDLGAIAQVRALSSELHNHAAESRAQLDATVQHELREHGWFQRRVEVWIEGVRIGGPLPETAFAAWIVAEEGCRTTREAGTWLRLCVVRSPTDSRTTLVVGSPIAPILWAIAPIFVVIALAALLTAAFAAALGALTIRRKLAPLSNFEQTLTAMPATGLERRVQTAWGAAEIDALADAFNGLLARIDQAVEREHRFVADAAHELRTPLTRLRAQLELAVAESHDRAEQPAASARLSAAARSCEELGRTTEALLALARDEIAADQTVDLWDIVNAQQREFSEPLRARIRVAGNQETLVRGDERLLSLAVRNVLDNALKYSAGDVEVELDEAHGSIRLVVTDSGPGIAPDDLERVREPFVRGAAHGSKRVAGAGLGLALVAQVTRLHGGAMQLGNRSAGAGLQVALCFPAWTPVAAPSR